MKHTLAALALALATLGVAAPAEALKPCPTEDSPGPCHWNAHTQGNGHGHSVTNYRHHRSVTGRVALTLRQVHNVEHTVHRLPECKPHTNHWRTNCREFVGHHHTLASFEADGFTYYVGLIRGRLAHTEVYR